jgi:hypothetical protein
MVTDQQVRRLFQYDTRGLPRDVAAAKAGLDPKTARKYRRLRKLPSEVSLMARHWRTRPDAFADVWHDLEQSLRLNPGLEAKTLFADLQRRFPGRFTDGQLRALQRRVKQWRALNGPAREVFFDQVHHPGRLGASDFTHCSSLQVTLNGQRFDHLIYHFVLTYSNWEAGTVCFSESYESLAEGLQNALWQLGGVPHLHRTDRMSAAVGPGSGDEFTQRYQALLRHYRLEPQAINVRQAHENGDCEQSHHRFKRALDQALLLRGGRDFASRDEYAGFLRGLFAQLNKGRRKRLEEELPLLRSLPVARLEACKRWQVRVDRGSTIHVQGNTYSVPARLIGEWVECRLFAERIELFHGQTKVQELPRLRGSGGRRIDYRHVIDWLVRKPGAFADYRYQAEMFPTSRFRLAYDALLEQQPRRAAKEYVRILHLAARGSEVGVEAALALLMGRKEPLSAAAVEEELRRGEPPPAVTGVTVGAVDLSLYDRLLESKEAEDEDGERDGREAGAGGAPEGTAPAGVPQRLRGDGGAGAAGVAELRTLPAGAGAAGVPGAA